MSPKFTRDEIFQSVRDCLAESLAIPAQEIRLDSSLIKNLNADSLDLLDILFQLEKKFSITLRNADLDQLVRGDLKENKLVEGKYLTSDDVNRLAAWLPALKSAENKDQITPARLFSYITVESLVILVEKKLGA